jgi:predicted RNA-binding Zn ribbon-like protein
VTDTTADLVVVEEFLNTLDQRTFSWHGQKKTGGDTLTSPAELSAWLEAHDLAADGAQPGPCELAAALALRGALRAALLADGDGANPLADFPLRLAPDPSGQLRISAATGLAGLDTLVETVASAVAGGRWHRLKLCAAPDCRWAFYDASRNSGGRWCQMEACGNRHKTRSYRRRQAAPDSNTST